MTLVDGDFMRDEPVRPMFYYVLLTVALLLTLPETIAGERSTEIETASYSPYVKPSYPTNVFWGDTHLHTNHSIDANFYGNEILGPKEAYRFAKGETIIAHNGMKARLHRPLDFLLIADHAVNLGMMSSIQTSDPALLETEAGRYLYSRYHEIQSNPDSVARENEFNEFKKSLFTEISSEDTYRQSIWQRVTAEADNHNDPGKFTAFIGYEWSPCGYKCTYLDDPSEFGNLHRVVVFKDRADDVNQFMPFSYLDSQNPEDLWNFMDSYQNKTGGEVLAIPHNGNTSRGEMFSIFDFDGHPLNQAYAKTRSRWEPLYEVTQIKGDSETHPTLSPADEFSDYETWNGWRGRTTEGLKTDGWINRKKSEYARSALKLGLSQKAKLGANPFKFGMIGSTDAHTSLATADDNNFWGKFSATEPNPNRVSKKGDILKVKDWEFASSGYAAVWAEENTREALFAAMKRKEVYASTGPRITVRFFGGWDYVAVDAVNPDLARIGYSKGVPMGGDLSNAPKGEAPRFLIRAVKDPDGANLDRVQVIKGWRDKAGELHEKIYNVALSDGRKPNWRGKVAQVGSTVDVINASYTNSIGDPELAIVWKDPDFDKDELSFYYLRVLEIPTPRWTAYDAKFFGIENVPDEVPMVTQERAYSSPIWYTP